MIHSLELKRRPRYLFSNGLDKFGSLDDVGAGQNAAHDQSQSSKATMGGWEGIYSNLSLMALYSCIELAAKNRKKKNAKPVRTIIVVAKALHCATQFGCCGGTTKRTIRFHYILCTRQVGYYCMLWIDGRCRINP